MSDKYDVLQRGHISMADIAADDMDMLRRPRFAPEKREAAGQNMAVLDFIKENKGYEVLFRSGLDSVRVRVRKDGAYCERAISFIEFAQSNHLDEYLSEILELARREIEALETEGLA